MSSDVRYILDIQNEQVQKEKKPKEKPGFLNIFVLFLFSILEIANRELFSLIGGVPPLLAMNKSLKIVSSFIWKRTQIVQDNKQKKCEKWIWTAFSNEGRADDLKLFHWEKESNLHETYSFSKLNKQIQIVKYSEEDYDKFIMV